jgi:hypothetical protein
LKELKQAKPNQVRPQYVFRDLAGNPISKAKAKAIINAKWKGLKYKINTCNSLEKVMHCWRGPNHGEALQGVNL